MAVQISPHGFDAAFTTSKVTIITAYSHGGSMSMLFLHIRGAIVWFCKIGILPYFGIVFANFAAIKKLFPEI